MEKAHTLTQDLENSYINGVIIPDSMMEEVDWSIRDRKDFIQELSYTMIPEAYHSDRTADLFLMEEDLEYLKKYEDDLMFDSLSTNEYIMASEEDDREQFNDICEQMLTLVNKIE